MGERAPVLVTGTAGFIGHATAHRLLDRGEQVIGVDIVNDYYDPALKEARLRTFEGKAGFAFHRMDIADVDAMAGLVHGHGITRVIHLAAQAGVRYSLQNPFAYERSNLAGHLSIMEACRHAPGFEHLVYASSSSVYGDRPIGGQGFSEDEPVNSPVSLYAATKRACELMSQSYATLYGFPQTGLRFFTVYGPWGRPDMAAYIFISKIMAGEPIPVFNHGDMQRDFTFVDDIVTGVVASLDRKVDPAERHNVYNIGNHQSEPLMRFIGVIEQALGKKAEIDFQPMQPGDVQATYADIEATRRDLGFEPTTPIDVGIPRFVEWYRDYHGV